MNLVVILCASFIFALSPFSFKLQEKTFPKAFCPSSITGEKAWKTEYRDTQIHIESTIIVHTDKSTNMNQERVVFRYTNLTAKKTKITFARKMYYNGTCYGCDKTDKVYSVELNPNEAKEYSEVNRDKTFYIFSKDLNGTIKKGLNNYELLNIETLVQ